MADSDKTKPINIADLYGPSGDGDIGSDQGTEGDPGSWPTPDAFPPASMPDRSDRTSQNAVQNDLVYEETPIIEPIFDNEPDQPQQEGPEGIPAPTAPPATEEPVSQPQAPVMPAAPQERIPSPRRSGRLRGFLFFVMIFLLGIGASVVYKNLVVFMEDRWRNAASNEPVALAPTPLSEPTSVLQPSPTVPAVTQIQPTVAPTGTPVVSPTPKPAVSRPTGWTVYQILRGRTDTVVAGGAYQLPPEVTAPSCDGSACLSRGTYLPGGTRFTVAVYTKNILTPDFSRTIVTDAAGRPFETAETTVSGRKALSYEGIFSGVTTGGYRFTWMRGVMIGVDSGTTIEINHFAPAGIKTDFYADDSVFDKILTTVTFGQ